MEGLGFHSWLIKTCIGSCLLACLIACFFFFKIPVGDSRPLTSLRHVLAANGAQRWAWLNAIEGTAKNERSQGFVKEGVLCNRMVTTLSFLQGYKWLLNHLQVPAGHFPSGPQRTCAPLEHAGSPKPPLSAIRAPKTATPRYEEKM